MISTLKFLSVLEKKKINFFCGVPDSCLNNFLNLIEKKHTNITTPNEGSAIALGIGYYLKTKKIPLIYMQNSGIGNAIDPLTSLCSKESYSIPMIILVGWRGSPNIKDEPQHKLMGKITLKLFKLLNIKTQLIKKEKDIKKILNIINFSKKKKIPIALIIEPKVFSKIKKNEANNLKNNFKNKIYRPEAIECIMNSVKKNTKIITTVGFTSREFYQIQKEKKINKCKGFLMIGGMGHTSMTSLGVSLNDKNDVLCLDGDGSFLMHMGGIPTAVNYSNRNFKYILFDNNSHESVGVQPTISNKLNFKKLAEGFGFKKFFILNNKKNYKEKLKKYLRIKEKVFILINTRNGSLPVLERPKNITEIKNKFMKQS